MPVYQVHRLKESHRQHVRWAPHTSGVTIAKPKDYEKGSLVEAASPYAVWMSLRETADALEVGDVVEMESGELRIYKYIGFEEAKWFVPEPPASDTTAPGNATAAEAIAAPQPTTEPPVEVT
jgi:hypothetical protein